MVWIAYQTIYDCPWWLDINRVVVAIFDSEEKAREYCKTSKGREEHQVMEMDINSEVPDDEDRW